MLAVYCVCFIKNTSQASRSWKGRKLGQRVQAPAALQGSDPANDSSPALAGARALPIPALG